MAGPLISDSESAPVVETGALCLDIAGVRILSDIDVVVAPGEVVAVCGPSGSGKSTLLHALAGIEPISSGHARVAGVDLRTADAETLAELRRTRVGLLYQFGELLPELSLLENVTLPMRLQGRSRRVATDAARGAMARLGVGELHRRRPSEVSGGQLLRVALARAVAHGPDVVLADEPTGALDRANGDVVMDAVREAARTGTAFLIATHDPRIAGRADRVLTLEDGAWA